MSSKVYSYFFKTPLSVPTRRFPELDLLRFFAAIMVLFYHYTASGIGNTLYADRYNLFATTDLIPSLTPITRFGFMGVNLFFMISGFIIFISAYPRSAIDFAVTRAIRLYPTYWLSIIFSVTVLLFFLGWDYPIGWTDTALNLTMVQPYLGAAHLDPVFWTLVVELHFYFLVFLLLITGQKNAWRFWLTLWLSVSWLITLVDQLSFLNVIFEAKYAGYFIAGVLFSIRLMKQWDQWANIMLISAFGLCLMHLPEQIALYNFGQSTPGMELTGSLILLAFFASFWLFSTEKIVLKEHRYIILLGSLTYPLYLVHHQFGRYFIDHIHSKIGAWPTLILTIFLSLLIAYLILMMSDRWLTPPIRKLYRSISQRQQKPKEAI